MAEKANPTTGRSVLSIVFNLAVAACLVCACCLGFFVGCTNQDRLDARKSMVDVAFWLMHSSDIAPPSDFDLIVVKTDELTIRIDENNADTINDLRQALSSGNHGPGGPAPIRDDKMDRIGTLTIFQNNYDYEMELFDQNGSLCFNVNIPGDIGGASLICLPETTERFHRFLTEWSRSADRISK